MLRLSSLVRCFSFVAALGIVGAALPAWALSVTFSSSFDTAVHGISPEGLAYNPADGLLYTTQDGDTAIYKFTTTGTPMGTVTGPLGMRGLDFLPNGDLLISSGGAVSVTQWDVSGTTATQVDGVNFRSSGFPPLQTSDDWQAVIYDEQRDSIFVSDDGLNVLFEFDVPDNTANPLPPLLTPLQAIDTAALDLNFEDPSGMAYDPATGNLVIVDDSSGGNIAFIWEVSPDGDLLDSLDIAVLTAALGGLTDPEGAAFGALNPDGTRQLFVAFENQQEIVAFDIAAEVPEAGAASLLGLGLLGLGLRRRRS